MNVSSQARVGNCIPCHSEQTVKNTAPIWQAPGAGWERVPLVPYESFGEFKALLREFIDEYNRIVSKVLDDNVGDRNMQLDFMACYGLSWDVKHQLIREGTTAFLKLTKGVGKGWCELVSVFLVHILSTAARVFVFSGIPCPTTGFDTFEKSKGEISDLLDREICLFVHDMDINPMRYYSFHRVNFKRYRNNKSHPRAKYSTDNCSEEDSDVDEYIPTGKFQDIMTAFAMGRHARLGAASSGCAVGMLTDDLIKLIFTYNIF
jgi:hypothetical protein